MNSSVETLGVLATFLIAAGIAGLILFLNKILGPKNKRTPEKAEPFECGLPKASEGGTRLSVKFYLLAMLFILFDVEIVWLFPWAVILRSLGWAGIAEMFTFLAFLALGFAYAWKKGALEWER
ncbi:MAG: NADH-quinone oxidoreductase subunit A [Candidatus Omnitrophica bacterium]|nr:NADH-quinone oxidoreductase subunit A [Candidatus Omnitrophota bacterium]